MGTPAEGDADAARRVPPAPARVHVILAAITVPLLIATAVGVAVLWPRGKPPDLRDRLGAPAELVDGTVTSTRPAPCSGAATVDTSGRCEILRVRLTSGSEKGRTVELDWTAGAGSPDVDAGDAIVLGHVTDLPPGTPPGNDYYFSDFQRRAPLLWLALAFAVVVVVIGRMRGARALVALAVSLAVLVKFVLPALLDGRSPLGVAITGSALILVVALYLSHGVNVRTTTAVLGTLASLAIIGALGVLFVEVTHLTGLASEEATFLQAFAGNVDVQGLLLGGMIIGSLGVLDDVTVTQASAVWELHQVNPRLSARGLYTPALRIGRDHIASTINTLVLAYAGASLPLLILFTQSFRRLSDVLTGEIIAVEIVRTLVGSMGLVASVPITTGLTAIVITAARGQPAGDTDSAGKGAGDANGDQGDDSTPPGN